MSKVQSLTHPTPKLFCYKFWAMSQANGSGYWAGLTGRPTGYPWVKKLTHSLSHWATGLPTGFNITGLGCPLAWWASGLLGQPMGHGLFDDPYQQDVETKVPDDKYSSQNTTRSLFFSHSLQMNAITAITPEHSSHHLSS